MKRRCDSSTTGQTAAEYAVVLGVIALGVIAVIALMRGAPSHDVTALLRRMGP